MFTVGQKVACVDACFPVGILRLYNALPRRNEIYTVRDIIPGVAIDGREGEVAVYLCEIVSPKNKYGIERGFNAERFAPLTTVPARQEEERPAFADHPAVLEPAFA